MKILYFISPLMAFLLVHIIMPILQKIAPKVNLLDKPNYRKVHDAPVPLVGGIAIFFAITFSLGMFLPFLKDILSYRLYFIALFAMLILGVLDDARNLKALLKLAVQFLLAHLVYIMGLKIESLHGLFGIYQISELQQYFLTIFAITGVVNAFNLMDGIDGLAGGVAVLAFLVFSLLAIITKQYVLLMVFLTFIGALLAFLIYNHKIVNKVFMGDAGSLIIGFVLITSGIKLVQSAQSTSKISVVAFGVVAVLLVPVIDSIRVFRKRIKQGKSPFYGDKNHLHHLVIETGIKHKLASISIVFVMVFLGFIGYVFLEEVGLTVALTIMLVCFYLIVRFLQFNNRLVEWMKKIQGL